MIATATAFHIAPYAYCCYDYNVEDDQYYHYQLKLENLPFHNHILHSIDQKELKMNQKNVCVV